MGRINGTLRAQRVPMMSIGSRLKTPELHAKQLTHALRCCYSPRVSLTNGMVSLRWAVIEA